MSHHDELEELREQYPAWRFGTMWVSAGNRPDACRLWARQDEILLTAWNAPELRVKIKTENR